MKASLSRLSVDPFPWVMFAIAAFAGFAILSLIATVLWLSIVNAMPGDINFGYTSSHYVEVLLDPFTYRVFFNTVWFAGTALLVALGVGMPIAWLAERTDFPGRPVVFTLMTISLLIPSFAVALGWVFLLHPRIGLINVAIVDLFGLNAAPFNVSTITVMGVIEGLNLAPVAFVMTAVALRSMDPALEEAASMCKATNGQILRRITLPILWPAILGTGIYIFTISFAAFDIPGIIGLPNRIFTFATYVFSLLDPSAGEPDYGAVATLSVLMIAVAVGLSAWYNRIQSQASKYAVLVGKSYRPRILPLKRLKILAVCFVALYFVTAQLLPLLVLVWSAGLPYLQVPSSAALAQFSLANLNNVGQSLILRAIGNTVLLMVMVPTLAMGISLAISWIVLRSKVKGRSVFDFLAFLPQAIPPIVFSAAALLITLFVLNKIIPIYGTIWILVAIYAIGRLAYGTRMTNSALIQIHRELDEAAQVSGANSLAVMKSILLPLLKPMLLYSWIWIALFSYRELSLPILLASPRNQPLSVVVWSYVATSAYGSASAIALLMLVLLSPVLCLYWIAARRAGIVAPP